MDYQAAVSAIRQVVPGAIAVYLFGSRARGDAARDSDVDLALLAPAPLDAITPFELQERIATTLHSWVDLVDLRAASAVMRVQVLEHGKLLDEGDAAERARFEMTALAQYARLNEERKGILEDIERTGRVHAQPRGLAATARPPSGIVRSPRR